MVGLSHASFSLRGLVLITGTSMPSACGSCASFSLGLCGRVVARLLLLAQAGADHRHPHAQRLRVVRKLQLRVMW